MTKKDQIKKLLPLGLSNAQIAKRAGTSVEYVKKVRWEVNSPETYRRSRDRVNERNAERYKTDHAFRAKQVKRAAKWVRANPLRRREQNRVTVARRKAYAEMKAKEARA